MLLLVSLTGLGGPARWGSVVGPRGRDLVFPWSAYPRTATATMEPSSQGRGSSLKIRAHEKLQTPFRGSPQQSSDELAFSRGLLQISGVNRLSMKKIMEV